MCSVRQREKERKRGWCNREQPSIGLTRNALIYFSFCNDSDNAKLLQRLEGQLEVNTNTSFFQLIHYFIIGMTHESESVWHCIVMAYFEILYQNLAGWFQGNNENPQAERPTGNGDICRLKLKFKIIYTSILSSTKWNQSTHWHTTSLRANIFPPISRSPVCSAPFKF
jgi:hypothetical protein